MKKTAVRTLIVWLCAALTLATAAATEAGCGFAGIDAALGLFPQGMTWDDIARLEGELDETAGDFLSDGGNGSVTQVYYAQRSMAGYPCSFGSALSADTGTMIDAFYAFDPYDPAEGDGGQREALMDLLRAACGEPTYAGPFETQWELPGGIVTLSVRQGGEDAVSLEFLLLICEIAPPESY